MMKDECVLMDCVVDKKCCDECVLTDFLLTRSGVCALLLSLCEHGGPVWYSACVRILDGGFYHQKELE